MEKELRLSEQLANEQTIKNIHVLKEKVGTYDLDVQRGYFLGYVDKDLKELMKEDGKLSELFTKILKHTRTDEEQEETIDGLYQLIDVVYKAGFACGSDLN